ncbi:hypothetical protein MASR2M29_19570 [Spirochaetota bacterium]
MERSAASKNGAGFPRMGQRKVQSPFAGYLIAAYLAATSYRGSRRQETPGPSRGLWSLLPEIKNY